MDQRYPVKNPQQLIEDIGKVVAEVAELPQVLRAAAGLLLGRLGDLVVIALAEPDGGHRIEVGHADGTRRAEAAQLVGCAAPSLGRLAGLSSQGFHWLPEVTPGALDTAGHGDARLVAIGERLGIRSLIVVALESGGTRTGVLGLARTEAGRPYHAQDLALAQVLARRLGPALEAARLRSTVQEVSRSHIRLEGALRKWTRVFDVAAWGAALVHPGDATLAAVNDAFAHMHGYPSADDLIGRPFDTLVASGREGEPAAWPALQEQPGSTYESLHRRADGRTFPVLVSVTRLDLDHQPESYVVTVQDLTDLKRAEERLRRAQRMEAVGRLAGGVAHEVNNMMTIILGFSDLLSRAGELPEALQGDVDEIRKAAARAGKITQQLLAYSRQQRLQPVELRLNTVVEDLAPVLRLLIPANIRVEAQLSPIDATVLADRGQLEQVLINLTFNARDAMPEGGTIRIATEARYLSEDAGQRLIGVAVTPGRYGLISVIDTGHGMDEATLEQLFQPFFTTKPAGMGTGLGLATVYGIVKQSGGYVWADSTPGEGTTFTVGLPLVAATAPAERERDPDGEPAEIAGGTILIVEDEAGVRQLAARLLASRGYRVLEARNGEEALAALGQLGEEVDLVLTDVVVPDLGTGELARRVREAKGAVPILYMSGYPREEVVQRGMIREDQPFLQKPFTAEGLMEAVGRTMPGNPVVGRSGRD